MSLIFPNFIEPLTPQTGWKKRKKDTEKWLGHQSYLVYWYIWHIAHLTQQLLMLIGLMIIVLYVQNIHGELILPFVKDSHSC